MRILVLVIGVLVAFVSAITAGAATSEQETWYLGADGFPEGSLLINPQAGELTNFDRGRDVEHGLYLERSELGLAEQDGARYQHWQIEAEGMRFSGYPEIVIWSSADRFAADTTGIFELFILDCDASGDACSELGSTVVTMESGSGLDWVASTAVFDEIDHVFAERRYLGVRVVVSAVSDADMIFAYGNPTHRSRLTVYPEPPAQPVATTVAPEPPPTSEVVVAVEPAVVEDAAPLPEIEATVTSGVWPWLITTAMSTVALVAFGALLMSSLTKPGRHERVAAGIHATGDDQARRISVSAP